LGRERDGLAMSVVEVGGAAPVPQPPARAFLGREARGDESVRERAPACPEGGPPASHLPRREESDVALCGGRGDVTPSKLVELHESPPARSRRSREEGGEGDGEERAPPPAKIERDEDDRPRAEGERRPDGLRREKAEERRHEAECGEAAAPCVRAGFRGRREEEKCGHEERHPDVARVSDEAGGEKPGLRGIKREP